MDYEEYKRKALEPIVNYIESVMASYSKEELEARIKKALPEKESEDERIRKELISYLVHRADVTAFVDETKDCERWIAYLEKQKDEAQKQFNLGMQAGRKEVMYEMEKEQKPSTPEDIAAAYQMGLAKGRKEQKPAEWSEDDKKILDELLDHCNTGNATWYNWLKSLRPQPHWKPTEKMLEALKWAKCEFHPDCSETMEQLEYLYTELKKIYYDGD